MIQFEIKYSNKLSFKEKKEWSKLKSGDKKGRLYSSIEWLNMVEKSDGIPQNLALVKQADSIVMGITFDIMPSNAPKQYNLDDIVNGNSEYIIKENIDLSEVEKSFMPTVCFTSRASRSCDLRYSKNLSDEKVDELFKGLLEYIKDENEKLKMSFLYIPEDNKVLMRNLEACGYNKYLIAASYYKKMNITDFSQYLDLYSNKKRSKIKNEINNLTNSEYEVEILELKEVLPRYVELVGFNFEKYGFPNFNTDSYIKRMNYLVEEFGCKAKTINIIKDGIIYASSLYIDFEDIFNVRGVGVDYANTPKNISPYFNVVYYEGLKEAIKLKSEYFVVGDGLDEVKYGRKMDLEKLYIFSNEEESQFVENMNKINDYSIKRLGSIINE